MFRLLLAYTVLAGLADYLRRRELSWEYVPEWRDGEIRTLNRVAVHRERAVT